MANVKLVIDRRTALKDGSYPIVFCISCNGSTRNFHSGFHIHEHLWNEKECSVRKHYPAHDKVNYRLREMEIDIRTKMIECVKLHGSSITAQRIKDYILEKPVEETTVYSFWKNEIEMMQQAGRNGGARIYMDALSAIGKIYKLNISFEVVDYLWLKKLEAQLGKNGVGVNSISIYLRTFRAIYNKAINAKVVSYNCYPFRGFRIRKEQTSPQAISLDEIRSYFNLNIPSNSHLYDSWLMGKLMFMLIGINFKDMLMLNAKNIQHGRIVYARAKTGKHYSVKMLSHASQIMDHFMRENGATILGKLSDADIRETLRLPLIIKQRNKVFNKHLRQLGISAGIKIPMRSYVFRYTWANLARQLGYNKDLIAQALGHNSGNLVTEIYLNDYRLEEVDAMNQKLVDSIMCK